MSLTIEAAPAAHPQPTADELIAQLRADLTDERARALRLRGYITEILGAAAPGDFPIPAWEAGDFQRYWYEIAQQSLAAEDAARGRRRNGGAVPVMADPARTPA